MLRAFRAHGDERKVDVGGIHARKLDLGLFRGLLQTLHRHFVLGKIDCVGLFELIYEILYNLAVPVVAAQLGVAVGGEHFKYAVGNFQDGNVERTAAEVVDHDLAALVLIEAVSERGRRGLVDDTQNVKPRDFARVLGRLALAVGEVCGAGDDRLRNLRAEICLRVRLQLGQNHSGNLLGRIRFVVYVHLKIGSHMSLDGNDGFVGVRHRLTLRRLPHHAGAVLLERYHGRGRPGAFRIGDNDGLAAFHHRHTRICCT